MILQEHVEKAVALPSPFGPLVLAWREAATGPRVVRILLSRPGDPAPERWAREHRAPLAGASSPPASVAGLGARLQAFLAGEALDFALARNPFPLVVPCHRAIRSDGGLGDYQGGRAMKRALLEREGIEVTSGGRVRGARLCYAGPREARAARTGREG